MLWYVYLLQCLFVDQIAELQWSIPLILQHELCNIFFTFVRFQQLDKNI